jgi:hypothetical protein
MGGYKLVKQNLRYLSEFRQRYALNLKLIMEFTGDSPTAYFRYVRHHSFRGSKIMWNKMIDKPNEPIDISFLHFLGISKRYNIPLDDLISTNLWEIDYEKYFRMYKLQRNCIRDYILNNQYTSSNIRSIQKMLKSDSEDKTNKLIFISKSLKEAKRVTSFDTVKMIKMIKTKNSGKRLKRSKAPE